MMKFFTFSPQYANGSFVGLADICALIPDNTLVWSILEFHGVGIAPKNMDMQDFETLARLNSLGFQMTWGELKDFAIHVDDTYDCLIAGAESPSDFFKDKSERENFSTCEIVIEAFDSGEWSMWARDEKIMAAFTNPTSGFQPLVL